MKEFENEGYICHNRCKGTNRKAVNETKTDEYYHVIGSKTCKYIHQTVIRINNHALATVKEKRQMLSPMVDKRHLYPCRIHTDPHGSQITLDWLDDSKELCPYHCNPYENPNENYIIV